MLNNIVSRWLHNVQRKSCKYLALIFILQLLIVSLKIWDSPSSLFAEKEILISNQEPETCANLGSKKVRASEYLDKQDNLDHVQSDLSTPDMIIRSTVYRSIFDKSRKFKTANFFITGDNWNSLSSANQVCLCAQTSMDRIFWLLDTVENWSGPISIALFVPDVEFHISLIYLRYLRKCYSKIKRQVSFHVTFPVNRTIKMSGKLKNFQEQNFSCQKPKEVLRKLLNVKSAKMKSWRKLMKYPQNLLRNVAKRGCQTNYTFLPDIDMIPVQGLSPALEEFLSDKRSSTEKRAFVIPTFEIKTTNVTTKSPANKCELVKLVKTKLARPFHEEVFDLNQKSSDLNRWLALTVPLSTSLKVAYRISDYVFGYEPIYVARANTPEFDERFIGYGMTRNTQIYEMHAAGYIFEILDNAFTTHAGFQASQGSRPPWRANQQTENEKRFPAFKAEINAKYGRTWWKRIF